jgi:hypothetical protein
MHGPEEVTSMAKDNTRPGGDTSNTGGNSSRRGGGNDTSRPGGGAGNKPSGPPKTGK